MSVGPEQVTAEQLTVVQHSLVQHHLGELRNRDTPSRIFRNHIRVLATLLAAEATQDLATEEHTVTTPIAQTTCRRLSGRTAAVPILRAGLGMVEPLADLIPSLEIWHLGLYRDESTAEPVHYYDKLPGSNPPDVAIVTDPMLATGGSACLAIAALRRWKVPRILLLSVIAAPEGLQKVMAQFPDVSIYVCAVDRGLDDRKFIVPGLGDAGDRIFNT